MPGSGYSGEFGNYFGDELISAVNASAVPETRVADMAARILTPYFWLGQDADDYPKVNFDYNSLGGPANEHVDVRADHWKVAKQIGEESATLLKNSNDTVLGLPIANLTTRIAIFGNSAGPPEAGLTGCGPFLNCFNDPTDSKGFPGPRTPSPQLNGTNYMGGGSGSVYPTYVVSPLEAISERARDTSLTVDFNLNSDPANYPYIDAVAANSDKAIVFVSAFQTEAWDREDLSIYKNESALIEEVAAHNSDVVVVIHSCVYFSLLRQDYISADRHASLLYVSGQTVDMESWIEHPNVTAVVFAYYAGDQVGSSIASVLFGDVSPSGKLPFTVGKSIDDYAGGAQSVIKDDIFQPDANFTEGVFIDYKVRLYSCPLLSEYQTLTSVPILSLFAVVRRRGHHSSVPLRLRSLVLVVRVLQRYHQGGLRRRLGLRPAHERGLRRRDCSLRHPL